MREYGKKQRGHEKKETKGNEEKSPDGISLSNQNTIKINIIW